MLSNVEETFDRFAPKKPTNVSINSSLLSKAREMNINLSATLELALTELVRQKAREQWLAENLEAINQYNAFVDENGVFSDEMRGF